MTTLAEAVDEKTLASLMDSKELSLKKISPVANNMHSTKQTKILLSIQTPDIQKNFFKQLDTLSKKNVLLNSQLDLPENEHQRVALFKLLNPSTQKEIFKSVVMSSSSIGRELFREVGIAKDQNEIIKNLWRNNISNAYMNLFTGLDSKTQAANLHLMMSDWKVSQGSKIAQSIISDRDNTTDMRAAVFLELHKDLNKVKTIDKLFTALSVEQKANVLNTLVANEVTSSLFASNSLFHGNLNNDNKTSLTPEQVEIMQSKMLDPTAQKSLFNYCAPKQQEHWLKHLEASQGKDNRNMFFKELSLEIQTDTLVNLLKNNNKLSKEIFSTLDSSVQVNVIQKLSGSHLKCAVDLFNAQPIEKILLPQMEAETRRKLMSALSTNEQEKLISKLVQGGKNGTAANLLNMMNPIDTGVLLNKLRTGVGISGCPNAG